MAIQKKVDQKQLQKRATNPQIQQWSGGIILRGVDPYGYDPTHIPTFEIDVAAGGDSVDITLTSGDFSTYEFIRVNVDDGCGNSVSALYTGSPLTIDTSGLNRNFKPNRPGMRVTFVFRVANGNSIDDCNRTLDYYVAFDDAAWDAGVTIDTADRLNSDDRGQKIEVAAEYTTGPDQVTVDVTSIASVGLDVEVFENGGSIGTGTIGADGTFQLVDAGTRLAGDYTYKVVITTDGFAKGSFGEVTITVV